MYKILAESVTDSYENAVERFTNRYEGDDGILTTIAEYTDYSIRQFRRDYPRTAIKETYNGITMTVYFLIDPDNDQADRSYIRHGQRFPLGYLYYDSTSEAWEAKE